jgi:hypothetical protein
LLEVQGQLEILPHQLLLPLDQQEYFVVEVEVEAAWVLLLVLLVQALPVVEELYLRAVAAVGVEMHFHQAQLPDQLVY